MSLKAAVPVDATFPETMDLDTARVELEALVRAKYPTATFTWGRDPNECRLWLLRARIPVEDDLELSDIIAERETDFLVDYGLYMITMLLPDWPPKPNGSLGPAWEPVYKAVRERQAAERAASQR